MALEVQGNYSQNNMASVPPPSDDEDITKGKSDGSSVTIDGETVSEDIPEGEEGGEQPQPKQSFGSRLKDALASGLGKGFSGTAAAFTAATSVIASSLHIPPAVASAGMALVLAGGIGTGVIAVDQYVNTLNPALFVAEDCDERVADAKTADTTDSAVDEEAEKEKNAKIIYSALKGILGLDDAHIAACISNFAAESGVDPTGVETIFDEHYQMGPKKQAAMADIDSFTRNVVFNAYAGVCTLNTDFYCQPDGVARCGIGLAGQTGPNCKQLLEDAEGLGKDWWDMEFQFAWELATYEDKWKEFGNQTGDCETLALWFVHYYEGNANPDFDAAHVREAKDWEARMKSWTVDQAVVNNISQMMQQMGATGSKKEVEKRQKECTPCRSNAAQYDNSSIAAAAASYAYPTRGAGVGNDGTELYVKVHDAVFPGDTIYRSCDRSAATAIRWSGKDDDVPPGSTTETEQHFEAEENKKWKNVTSEIQTLEDLEPGDIWNTVTNGHIFVYCGEDIIQEIHGSAAEADMNMVEGSYPVQSPECSTLSLGATGSVIYRAGDDRAYYVWRNINPDTSDKYTGVADGITVTTAGGKKTGSKNCGDSAKNANRNKAELLDSAGEVNWDMPEDEFVETWGYAIDQWLAGSELAGQGKAFAKAAKKYNVDPRWCPAISCTESSKGAACFRDHNAWGFGQYDFATWEEGIDTVTKRLGELGGKCTLEAAKVYNNPDTYETWYQDTVRYMNEIQSNYKKF